MSDQGQLFKINKILYKVHSLGAIDHYLYFGFPPTIIALLYQYIVNPEWLIKFNSIESALFGAAGLTVGFGTGSFIISSLAYLLTSDVLDRRGRKKAEEAKRIAEIISTNDVAASDFAKRVANHLNVIKQPEHFQNLQLEEMVTKQKYEIKQLNNIVTQNTEDITKLKKSEAEHTETEHIYLRVIQELRITAKINEIKAKKFKNQKETLEKQLVEKKSCSANNSQNTSNIPNDHKIEFLD